jgi:superfamily I DNA and/or RNA helicase/energy-coupling factor transporter ATP-binding protein EcfA2
LQNDVLTYQRRLANLGASNKLIFLPRLTANDLDLKNLDFLNGSDSFGIINSFIEGNKRVFIAPVFDPRDASNNTVSNKLRQIQRRANYLLNENGSHELYLAWPFLHGNFGDNQYLRAPLLLWQTTLEQDEKGWFLQLHGDIQWNESLLLAYQKNTKSKLNYDILNKAFNDAPTDATSFITHLFNILKEIGFNIQFNRDLFSLKLEHFLNYKKNDFELFYNEGILKLFPEAVIGMFPLLGNIQNNDYELIEQKFNYPSIDNYFEHFFQNQHNQNDLNFINKVREEQIVTPFKIDIFQENIIKAVQHGKSVVVQGPPGTGKSQLIANLICQLVSQGKKVLVASEKKVALEVILQRLKSIEADSFVALVHDHVYDRESLYKSIANQIDKLEELKQSTLGYETIALERNFVINAKRSEQITLQLDDFKDAYFKILPCGYNVEELWQKVNHHISNKDIISDELANALSIFDLSDALTNIVEVQNLLKQAPKHYFWKVRKHVFDHIDFNNLNQNITDYKQALKNISSILNIDQEDINSESLLNVELEQLLKLKSLLNSDLNEILNILLDKNALKKITDLNKLNKAITSFQAKEKEVKLEIPSTLDEINLLLEETNDAILWHDKSLLMKALHTFSSNKNKKLQLYLTKNSLSFKSIDDIKKVHTHLENCKKITETIENSIFSGISSSISENSLIEIVTRIDNLTQLIELKKLFSTNSISYEYLFKSENIQVFTKKVQELISQLLNLKVLNANLLTTLTENQVIALAQLNEEGLNEVISYLNQYFNLFQQIDINFNALSVNEKKLFKLIENESIENVVLEFERKWLKQAFYSYPALNLLQNNQLQELSKELKHLIKEKQTLSERIVSIRLKEQTYKHLQYNRLTNVVSYRELKHQVNKKKNIWPIRKLIAENEADIFKLLPCWMASPETISAIFPLEQYFDVVIVDEASQCFSERGFPLIFRGKQIVVAGDSQQLSPSTLYQNRWEGDEDEEDSPTLEVESYLELCARYFPEFYLQNHYRSENYGLIAFSNEHFYKSKLNFTSRISENVNFPIQVHQNNVGIWENRSNEFEAEQVVNKAIEYYNLGKKSIGFISFNFNQQELIQQKIEQAINEKKISTDVIVFNKNIENVQGDEADIVLLSVAYAPDKKGNFKMQFGSLSQKNGEKRLNVAITRAKSKMDIFISFDPNQLQTETAKHEGISLLKNYLVWAQNAQNGAIEVPQNKLNTHWQSGLSMKHHFGYSLIR